MFTSKLMRRAYELLRPERGRYQEIADACGVSYSWLSKLSQGQFRDAAAGRLERLIDHLENNGSPPDSRATDKNGSGEKRIHSANFT